MWVHGILHVQLMIVVYIHMGCKFCMFAVYGPGASFIFCPVGNLKLPMSQTGVWKCFGASYCEAGWLFGVEPQPRLQSSGETAIAADPESII